MAVSPNRDHDKVYCVEEVPVASDGCQDDIVHINSDESLKDDSHRCTGS